MLYDLRSLTPPLVELVETRQQGGEVRLDAIALHQCHVWQGFRSGNRLTSHVCVCVCVSV